MNSKYMKRFALVNNQDCRIKRHLSKRKRISKGMKKGSDPALNNQGNLFQ